MKITFLTPPANSGIKPAERTAGCTRVVYPMPNIYELTVAALFEQEGYQVTYEDFILQGKKNQDLEEFLKKDNSFCYCFWSVNLSIETDLLALKKIRSVHPSVKVIFMGPGPTYYTHRFLVDENVIVVRGEPELTAKELMRCISLGTDFYRIKGLSFLKEERITHNPPAELIKNLDELPFPARHFIEEFRFSNPKLSETPYTTLVTSRNCPFKCIYCVPSSLTFAREIEYKKENLKKPPISYRSVENVVEELQLLHAKGYKAIGFMDDNFIVTAKRLRGIVDALKLYGFKWGCQARADAITEEVAQILADSGCQYIDLGVESFNDEILQYIKKGVSSKQIYEAINLLKSYKIPVKLNILIGTSPLETVSTIKDTLKTAKKLDVSQVMFNIVAPFPGTEFYEIAKNNKWIVGGDYVPTDVQRNSILNYPNLSSRQMERLLFWNNISFFLRPSFVFKHFYRFKSIKDFWAAFKALKIKLFG
jgi:radical SAM superfamily enzyme YgiQ (UPF0313 family)